MMRWSIGHGLGADPLTHAVQALFWSFLMMFRHKGVNKSRSTKSLQVIGKSFSQLCAKERVSESLEAGDEIIYIHQQDVCPLLWFNRESGWQEHYCQMYIACWCLQYFLCWEHTPSHPERHANVGAGGSAPQQRAFCSLPRTAALALDSQIQILILDSSRQGTKHI